MKLLQLPDIVPTDSIPSVNEEIRALKSLSFDDMAEKLVNGLVDFAIHLALAIFVFYVGRFIINKLYRFTSTVLLKRQVDRSLSTFVLSLIKMVLFFILIVTVIGIIGIETSSFIAIFASAGVAIGMALSGTLQNFAGGVLILLLKPYKIGDFIEAQGYAGSVKEIQIFHTIIVTPDNKSIIIPNGGLSTGSINNWSRETFRRVEWTVAISYGDDVDKAREVILGILSSDTRVVKKYIEEAETEPNPQQPETENNDTGNEKPVKRNLLWRLFHRHGKRVKAHIETFEERRDAELRRLMPKVDRSPSVNLAELADSSVNLVTRAWVNSKDFWDVYYSVNEKIYTELPLHGISFPFPQMDVHIASGNSEA